MRFKVDCEVQIKLILVANYMQQIILIAIQPTVMRPQLLSINQPNLVLSFQCRLSMGFQKKTLECLACIDNFRAFELNGRLYQAFVQLQVVSCALDTNKDIKNCFFFHMINLIRIKN